MVADIAYLLDALPSSPHVNYCREVVSLQVMACVADIHHLERGKYCFHTCIQCLLHLGDLPDNVKETIRQDFSIILRKDKPPKRNLSKPAFLTIKTVRDNLEIVILKVEKCGAIVIMDKSDYVSKMVDHLSNSGCYIKLKNNPLKSMCKDVSLAIKFNSSLNPLSRKLI